MNSHRITNAATFLGIVTILLVACSTSIETATATTVTLIPTHPPVVLTAGVATENTTPFGTSNEIYYEDLNVLWSECRIFQNSTKDNWKLAQECLNIIMSETTDEDKKLWSERFSASTNQLPLNQRLVIGNDIYESRKVENLGGNLEQFELTVNGEFIVKAIGHFTAYDINRTLLNVDGKVAWEFADSDHPTIFFDGENLMEKFSLDAAYFPNAINGKLIFIGEKDGLYFVMYDGQKVGLDFEHINLTYCCEAAMYSVARPPHQYWFWGGRDDQSYVVAITEK